MERHENISILFADICKFTELTTTLPVDKLVETLNDLFGKFDDAADVSWVIRHAAHDAVLTGPISDAQMHANQDFGRLLLLCVGCANCRSDACP